MPDYKLKSGDIIYVAKEDVDNFLESNKDATLVPKKEIDSAIVDQAIGSKEITESNLENGSSEPLSNEQASFNYEQRTGNKPATIMDLTDEDFIERGPMGNKIQKRNSGGVIITDYEEVKKTLKKTSKAKSKLIKLATNFATESLEDGTLTRGKKVGSI